MAPAGASASAQPPSYGARSWVCLERYSGRPGSVPVSPADFRQLAFELQGCRAAQGSSALSVAQRRPYETVAAPRNNLRDAVPLSVIHWARAVERQPAGAAGQSLAPAVTSLTVFACAPLRPKTYRGAALVFTLSADDVFEEGVPGGQSIVALRLDAGDGAGWRDIGAGEAVPVSYAETGAKTIQMEAVLEDGSSLSAAAPLEVAALATPNPTETWALSKATLYTYKSDAHDGYRNPVLVVEGFDLDNSMDWDVLYNLLNKEQLVETLRGYGRDFAVVDFNDATTSIYANAVNVMEAVRFINACRADPGDKFVVIGASMGGLVSRYALGRMEANPSLYGPHDVDTWISFDSPQEGANIPLGLQEFFSFFGGFADDYSDLAAALEYRKKLDTVAAQQMLLCHYKNTNAHAGRSPLYAGFETEMRAYGYPTNCKTVALSNGSKFGLKHPFAPGDLIINWYYDSFLLGISSKVYALYNSSLPSKPVFYGWFDPWDLFDTVDETVTKNRYYPYSVDNAAGGTRSSFQELFDTISSDMLDSGDTCAYPDHCFIPTTSALGIPKEYLEHAATNASVLALSPFDETHCAVTNESHIDINASNKRWFLRAALENRDSDGDGFDDYQEYLTGTAYNSATSRLEVAAGFGAEAASASTVLAWGALPNVRYDVYRAESLGQEWERIDSVTASAAGTLTRSYPMDPQKRSAFYKIVAIVADPVSD